MIWDILKILLGALIAFGSTTLTSILTRRRAVLKLTEKLKTELDGNRKALEEVQDFPTRPVRFDSPIWEIVSKSGTLLDLRTEIYMKIINITVGIKRLNAAEDAIGEVNDKNRDEIINERKKLLKIFDNNKIGADLNGRRRKK